jgi:hypothetical protein
MKQSICGKLLTAQLEKNVNQLIVTLHLTNMLINCVFYNEFRIIVYYDEQGYFGLLSSPNYYWRSPRFDNKHDPLESVKSFIDEVLLK